MHKGEKALLTSCTRYSLPSAGEALPRRAGRAGKRARQLSLPLRRKVSCVIKQRVRNVSSVSKAAILPPLRGAGGPRGRRRGCCPARIEARRVATGEDGRVKRSRKRREKKEKKKDGGRAEGRGELHGGRLGWREERGGNDMPG